MDCNREEALRAKQLAEKKMEIKDFHGALKIAMKAQSLYSELENISQMIAVCEVHCSAEKKSYGTDKDWYGILKIEPSADELSIKKTYRKLALVLHPDKNKFSGSTDAFKLIGEAQRVLLDREKRILHNSKRRAYGNVSAPKWAPPKQPTRPSNIHQSVNFSGVHPGNLHFTHQPAPHQSAPHHQETTGVGGNQDSQYFGEQPRRSSRAKRNVSYKEIDVDVDDDDDDTLSKQAKKSETSEQSVMGDTFSVKKEDKMKESDSDSKKRHQNDEVHSDSSKLEETANDEEEIETETFQCPDPEFSDFDKDRKKDSFALGQLWACYDTEDAMPRFYAYIKKVASSGFKLQIQWLKPDPVTPDEKKWVQEYLPVSCGSFKRDKNDEAEDLFSFSHLVTWETGQKAGTFYITPKKGETWAIFRNWSMKWHSCTEEHKYEYDFVEILSDYDENEGVGVSYLEKVNGFVCLFRRKEGGETIIVESEKYRFGHLVPSCRMSGTEREGVPEGSFELDPAALPSSTFEKVNM